MLYLSAAWPTSGAARTTAKTKTGDLLPLKLRSNMSMFQKVADWLAKEALVKALSNNKTFQQFALKTVKTGQTVANAAKSKAEAVQSSEKTAQTAQGLRGVRTLCGPGVHHLILTTESVSAHSSGT